MIDYKEYVKACEIKKQWENQKKQIQTERTIKKQQFPFENIPEDYIGQLKYQIEALSYKIAKEILITKSARFIEKAKNLQMLKDMYNDKIQELKNEKYRYKKTLFKILKNS